MNTYHNVVCLEIESSRSTVSWERSMSDIQVTNWMINIVFSDIAMSKKTFLSWSEQSHCTLHQIHTIPTSRWRRNRVPLCCKDSLLQLVLLAWLHWARSGMQPNHVRVQFIKHLFMISNFWQWIFSFHFSFPQLHLRTNFVSRELGLLLSLHGIIQPTITVLWTLTSQCESRRLSPVSRTSAGRLSSEMGRFGPEIVGSFQKLCSEKLNYIFFCIESL